MELKNKTRHTVLLSFFKGMQKYKNSEGIQNIYFLLDHFWYLEYNLLELQFYYHDTIFQHGYNERLYIEQRD